MHEKYIKCLTTTALWAVVSINEGTGAEEATILLARVEGVPGAVGRGSTGSQAGIAKILMFK